MPKKKSHSKSSTDVQNTAHSSFGSSTVRNKNNKSRRLLIFTHSNVRVYFLTPASVFVGNDDLQELAIVKLKSARGRNTTIVLEIGEIQYDLKLGAKECERLDKITFVLRDVPKGAKVKLVFPREASGYTCDRFYRILEDVLVHGYDPETRQTEGTEKALAVCQTQNYREREPNVSFESCNTPNARQLARSIKYASSEVSSKLVTGAEMASSAINYVTPVLVGNITPAQTPAHVDPTVQVGLKLARYTTQGAASASEVLGNQVGALASYTGQSLAPHVHRIGADILATNYNYTQHEAKAAMDNALEITASVANGIATVYEGFVGALKILGSSVSDNTVKVVKHTYGDSAGEAVDDLLQSVGNIANTRLNTQLVKKEGLVVQTARTMQPSQHSYPY